MKHLLVTNDFPPKVGGIQSYLWELWRRLPPDDVVVLTTPYEGDAPWDAAQPFRVERTREKVLLPTPALARRIDALADEVAAGLVLLDPALPLGLLGPRLRHRYGLVLHGAEVTVPGRLPGTHLALRHVLRGAGWFIRASFPRLSTSCSGAAARAGPHPIPAWSDCRACRCNRASDARTGSAGAEGARYCAPCVFVHTAATAPPVDNRASRGASPGTRVEEIARRRNMKGKWHA